MPGRAKKIDALEHAESLSGLPQHFAEAHDRVCDLIEQCDMAGIPTETTLAALMAELMPRLVETYGANGVATMLNRLADEVTISDASPASVQ